MTTRNTIILFCLMLLLHKYSIGQNNAGIDTNIIYSNSNSINNSFNTSNSNNTNPTSAKLLKSIGDNKTNEEIARNYYDLAEALVRSSDYVKAEIYINKAIQLESAGMNRMNLALYYRELARIQELQNKFDVSSQSYTKAASYATDSIEKKLNQNDATRLKYKSSPKDELRYLNENKELLSNSNNQNEKLQNYTQIAAINLVLNQNGSALENFENALNTVDSTSENSVLIKSNIVNIMAASNQVEKAIALQKDVVMQAQKNASIDVQIEQLRNLSALYVQVDSSEKAVAFLQAAYLLALEKGSLKQAKASVLALTNYYQTQHQPELAAKIYSGFLEQLDNLMSRDSSLIDRKLFLINEGKITELEQQQTLKDELIRRKNKSNVYLIGSVILLSVLFVLILAAWMSIRKRNKQIALQSLRREMNPHFIFNSLNSVNQFIANNNEREANKYLTSYSGLMRTIMENSNKDYVTLATEIEQLKKYLELERMRFPDKFNYQLEIDPALNTDAVLIPNMIIQPNLENAIWHGLRYNQTTGLLQLKFTQLGNKMQVIIEDNGIGLTASQNLKTKNQKMHESLGLKNVQERIRLLNELYKSDIRFALTEKTGTETGVVVQITW